MYHIRISVNSNQFGSISLHHSYVVEICEEENEDENSDISKQSRKKEGGKEEEEEHQRDKEDPNQPVGGRDPEPRVDEEDLNQPMGGRDPEPKVWINKNDTSVEDVQAVITDVRIMGMEEN